MKLFTKTIYDKLLCNGRINAERSLTGEDNIDFPPVVKLFTPDAACTWLLTELDPDDPDIAFGLCDLGMGCPELGSVRISELEQVRGRFGLPVERDRYFTAHDTLGVYARAAWNAASVTENPQALCEAAERLGGAS
ncbi:MAG: DUF2958 domain-containing protein [Candidatus Thiodiazotropha lotti]|nr:DUF2958 domain-containing protein [Candidatus Thiodiazotropha lotti]